MAVSNFVSCVFTNICPVPSCNTSFYFFMNCAYQLAPVYTTIFNSSLSLCTVPKCFKDSEKQSNTASQRLQTYRCHMCHNESIWTDHSVTPERTHPSPHGHQFTYRANSSVEDAVNLHRILHHLETVAPTPARCLSTSALPSTPHTQSNCWTNSCTWTWTFLYVTGSGASCGKNTEGQDVWPLIPTPSAPASPRAVSCRPGCSPSAQMHSHPLSALHPFSNMHMTPLELDSFLIRMKVFPGNTSAKSSHGVIITTCSSTPQKLKNL